MSVGFSVPDLLGVVLVLGGVDDPERDRPALVPSMRMETSCAPCVGIRENVRLLPRMSRCSLLPRTRQPVAGAAADRHAHVVGELAGSERGALG